MRILHVVESLERGGLERMVCDLAAEQRRTGVEVEVCAVFRPGLLAAELVGQGIAVHDIEKRGGFDLRAIRRLRSLVQRFAPDVIHTHNATAHYYTALATVGQRAPLVNTRHGMGSANRNDRREQLYRLALRRTARVVAVCRHAAERFVTDGIVSAAQMVVIPNGIRVERFHGHARAQAREQLGVADGAPLAGIVGRLNWAKDHVLLIKAFRLALESVPSARLAIIGDGELRAELERNVDALGMSHAVHFLGDRSDVPSLLVGFDVFVLSSKTEGYSIALLEASAAGVPMIVTDVGGNREIVADGVTGRLVPHGDPARYAAAWVELMQNAPLRTRLGEGAKQWADSHASVHAMHASYDALYRSLARGNGKSNV